jgi:hypothetical protein
MTRWMPPAPHNNRIQAAPGGAAVLNGRVGRAPAAPDADR